MKNTLLGIKIIGWLYIIPSILASIYAFSQAQYVRAIIIFLIGVILGINILKLKEAARKFAIFLSYISLVLFLALMFVVPYIGLNEERLLSEKQKEYAELKIKLAELENETVVVASEIAELKNRISELKLYFDRYPEFKKTMIEVNSNMQLNLSNVIEICFLIFIVYYLTRPYVKEEFKVLENC